jgi:hypothetical protein
LILYGFSGLGNVGGRCLKGAFERGNEAGVLVGDDQPHR